MGKPTMNCGGDFIDWEFESQPGGVTIKETPDICRECEFFQMCFMKRSSHILGIPMSLSTEAMTQLVYLQRLQDSGANDEIIGAYIQSMSNSKQ